MRLLIASLVALVGFTAEVRAQGTYIHAPVPPYCTPRGDKLCTPDESQAPDVVTEWSHAEIKDLQPSVRTVASVETHTAKLLFVGKSDLLISRDEEGRTLFTEIRVYSSRTLNARVARKLKRRFASHLSDLEDLWIDIDRYGSPSEQESEDDWCLLYRESKQQDWQVECGS